MVVVDTEGTDLQYLRAAHSQGKGESVYDHLTGALAEVRIAALTRTAARSKRASAALTES